MILPGLLEALGSITPCSCTCQVKSQNLGFHANLTNPSFRHGDCSNFCGSCWYRNERDRGRLSKGCRISDAKPCPGNNRGRKSHAGVLGGRLLAQALHVRSLFTQPQVPPRAMKSLQRVQGTSEGAAVGWFSLRHLWLKIRGEVVPAPVELELRCARKISWGRILARIRKWASKTSRSLMFI